MRVQGNRAINFGNPINNDSYSGGVKPGTGSPPGTMTFIRHDDGSYGGIWQDSNGNITQTTAVDKNGREVGHATFSPDTGKWQSVSYNVPDSGGTSGGQVANGNGGDGTGTRAANAPAPGSFTPSFGNSHPTISFSMPAGTPGQNNASSSAPNNGGVEPGAAGAASPLGNSGSGGAPGGQAANGNGAGGSTTQAAKATPPGNATPQSSAPATALANAPNSAAGNGGVEPGAAGAASRPGNVTYSYLKNGTVISTWRDENGHVTQTSLRDKNGRETEHTTFSPETGKVQMKTLTPGGPDRSGSVTYRYGDDGSVNTLWQDAKGNITRTAMTDKNGREVGHATFSPDTGKWQSVSYNVPDSGGTSGGQAANGNGAGGSTTQAANATPPGNATPQNSAPAPAPANAPSSAAGNGGSQPGAASAASPLGNSGSGGAPGGQAAKGAGGSTTQAANATPPGNATPQNSAPAPAPANAPNSATGNGGSQPGASGTASRPGTWTSIQNVDGTINDIWQDAKGNITRTAMTDKNGREVGHATFSPDTGKWQSVSYNVPDSGGTSGGQVANGNGGDGTGTRAANAPAPGSFTPSFGNSHPTISFSMPAGTPGQNNASSSAPNNGGVEQGAAGAASRPENSDSGSTAGNGSASGGQVPSDDKDANVQSGDPGTADSGQTAAESATNSSDTSTGSEQKIQDGGNSPDGNTTTESTGTNAGE